MKKLSVRVALSVRIAWVLLALAALCPPRNGAEASTLADIRSRGDLRCAVFPDDPGRSSLNDQGRWEGFYVDFCRAVAAATLGDPEFVHFIEVGPKSRFSVLMDDKADVVMYSATWTLGREKAYAVAFPAIYLFDGQGIMVRAGAGINSLDDLNGRSICATGNTTTLANLQSIIRMRGFHTRIVEANGDAFFRGDCEAYSADRVNLAVNRASRADDPARYRILPFSLSREPISPMVRDDDAGWVKIVRSVIHALILAEELGITRDNADHFLNGNAAPEAQNLLGANDSIATILGLDPKWAMRAIKSVGNYGEIFDRNFGPATPIGMERGLNRPWSQGGLLYAPLFK